MYIYIYIERERDMLALVHECIHTHATSTYIFICLHTVHT